MSPAARPSPRPPGSRAPVELPLVALALTGLAFWFVVGLPWAPHNESFDWVVRLEQRTFGEAVFEKFPSVLSLRPLGTGPAWVLYRLGGRDVGLVEVVNALLALAAWGWAAVSLRERRLFSLLALVSGGVFFAGYIWVFHLHGISYGPLLLYVAFLALAARAPLDLHTLLGAFVGALLTSLAHPYALPLVVAFVLGAVLETPSLRSRQGLSAVGVVLSGATAAYLLLVPEDNRGIEGSPLAGTIASFRTLEVNAVGTAVASLLAAWTATRALPGPAGMVAALVTLATGAAAGFAGLPALPLWLGWVAARCLRRGRWRLLALLAACALLPLPNPSGSPTYAVFAVFVAAIASALDEEGVDGALHALGGRVATALVALALALAIALRLGLPVPGLERLARPLLAEGERTRQFETLVDRLMDSAWRAEPARFVRAAPSPAEADALDRRFRPPTDDHHLATWLDWRRGGPATGADTLRIGFGGDAPAGLDTLVHVRGRWAGDALVLRRSSAALADSVTTRP
jgi:hypothetical protein